MTRQGERIRRACALAGATSVAGLIAIVSSAAGQAQQPTIIGSDLTLTADGVAATVTLINDLTPNGSTTPTTAPADGVLVEMKVKRGATGATPATYAFRIAKQLSSSPNVRFETRAASTQLTFPTNAAAGVDTFAPKDSDGNPVGIAIKEAERLAI